MQLYFAVQGFFKQPSQNEPGWMYFVVAKMVKKKKKKKAVFFDPIFFNTLCV